MLAHARPTRLVVTAALAALVLLVPAIAGATWFSGGNMLANGSNPLLSDIGTPSDAVGEAVASDGRGGLISLVRMNFDLRVTRLDRQGARMWGDGGTDPGTIGAFNLLESDGAGGAWIAGPSASSVSVQHVDDTGATTVPSGSMVISTSSQSDINGFAIAVTPAGKLLVAYWRSDGLYVQRVSQTGTLEWGVNGERVTTDVSFSTVNLHAVSEGCIVVWSSSRASLPGPSGASRIVANRLNSSSTVLWGAEGAVVQAGAGYTATRPRSFWDGTNLFVSWMRTGSPDKVDAQKVDGNGVTQWATNATGINVFTHPTAGSFEVSLDAMQEIVTDGAGGCILVWEDGRHSNQPDPFGEDHDADVYGQRLNSAGTALWQANGAAVDTSGGPQEDIKAISDRAGGAYLLYRSFEGSGPSTLDLVSVRLGGNGVKAWINEGIGVPAPPTASAQHYMAYDGAGGFVASWAGTGGNNARSYGTHYGPDGELFVPLTLTVTAPNGGESFVSSQIVPLTWTSNLGGTVQLQYSINNGAPQTIDLSEANDGTYNWVVPAISSSQVKVHVTLVGDPETDASNAFFSVCTSLGAPVQYSVAPDANPNAPRDLATGDFDEDGDLDLAVAVSQGVAIKLGSGAGTFPTSAFFATPSPGNGVTAGDFNEDGRLDLAVAHATGVSILLGNGAGSTGDGTFAAATTIGGMTNCVDVLAADFNADGILDLATVDSTVNRVHLLLGNGANGVGNGTFAGVVTTTLGVNGIEPEQLVAADFNEDGALDLAVTAFSSGNVGVMLGQLSGGKPTGALAAPAFYACGVRPRGLAIGDVDEDGIVDLIVALTGDPDGAALLRGNGSGGVGNGTFAARVGLDVIPGVQDVALGDFDENGRADILSANVGGFVELSFGNGTGSVGDGTFTLGGGLASAVAPIAIALGDFNGDLKPDMAAANAGSNTITVCLGGCTAGGTGITVTRPNGSEVLYPGIRDALTWTRGTNVMSVHVEVSRDNGANWERIANDLPATNFDWWPVVPTSTTCRLRVLDAGVQTRNDQSNASWKICEPLATVAGAMATQDANTLDVTSLDANEDGISDLVYLMGSSVVVRLGLGAGGVGNGSFSATENLYNLGAGISPFALDVGDLNNDGIDDVAVGTFTGLKTKLGGGTGGVGNGTFGATVSQPGTPYLRDLVLADLNEDGVLDAVGVGGFPALDSAYIYIGTGANGAGNGNFETPVRIACGPSVVRALVYDFNEDGIPDIAVNNQDVGTPRVAVMLGLGSGGKGIGAFGPVARYAGALPMDLGIADINTDGIPDLLAAVSGGIGYWPGNGSGGVGNGTFSPFQTLSNMLLAREVRLVDVNRDGRPDLLASRSSGPGQMELYAGLGTGSVPNGTFSATPVVFGAGFNQLDIALDDYDEDDVLDAVVGTTTSQFFRYSGDCKPSNGSVAMSLPAGGENWGAFTEHTIAWTKSLDVTLVDVEVSHDNGVKWQAIARNQLGTSFVWTVTPPTTANARIRVRDANVRTRVSTSAAFTIGNGVLDAPVAIPAEPFFSEPRPNPARGDIAFTLELPADQDVRVDVFDAAGRRVGTLARGALAAGRHTLRWDGRTDGGMPVRSGLYFVRAEWPGYKMTRRLVRLD